MELKLRKLLTGGAVPPQALAAPVQNQGPALSQGQAQNYGQAQSLGPAQNPIEQIAQLAVQALLNQDCNAALSVCEAFILLLLSYSSAPEGNAPVQNEPVYRAGGKLVKRI